MAERGPEQADKPEPPGAGGPAPGASFQAEPPAAGRGPAESQPAAPPPDAGPEGSAEPGSSQAVPLAALRTTDLVHSFLSVLAMKAWEGMGLVPNALSGKTEKNLEDARLAIDAYAAVFEVLRPRVEEAARRELENLLTTLRLNFVEKSAG